MECHFIVCGYGFAFAIGTFDIFNNWRVILRWSIIKKHTFFHEWRLSL